MKLLKTIIYKLYVVFLIGITIMAAQLFYPLIYGFDKNDMLTQSLQKLTGNESDEEKYLKQKENFINAREVRQLDLGYRNIKQTYVASHFHHIGFEIADDTASACVYCHGTLPHEEDKESRAFLNMHAFTMACESCHSQTTTGKGQWTFKWYDITSGKLARNPAKLVEQELFTGPFGDKNKKHTAVGNYGAKIAPGYEKDGSFNFLATGAELATAKNYMASYQSMAEDQREAKKQVAHENVIETALECVVCHDSANKYIPYEGLGYPPRRIKELTDSAIVSMMGKYERFYFPNFMEGSGRRK